MLGSGARLCVDFVRFGLRTLPSFQPTLRSFFVGSPLLELQKLTRVRIVDNSVIGQQAQAAGKAAKIIHVYVKPTGIKKRRVVGTIGDKVMVAIMGQKKRGYIVGVTKQQDDQVPSFDTNNVVLIDDNGAPLGTRIRVPIPMKLRSKEGDISKILAIATRFV